MGYGDTTSESYTIGTTNTSLLEPRPDNTRISFVIRNTSTASQVLSVALSNANPAVANKGIVLNAGDVLTDSSQEGYLCWQGRVSIISSAAGATCAVFARG